MLHDRWRTPQICLECSTGSDERSLRRVAEHELLLRAISRGQKDAAILVVLETVCLPRRPWCHGFQLWRQARRLQSVRRLPSFLDVAMLAIALDAGTSPPGTGAYVSAWAHSSAAAVSPTVSSALFASGFITFSPLGRGAPFVRLTSTSRCCCCPESFGGVSNQCCRTSLFRRPSARCSPIRHAG